MKKFKLTKLMLISTFAAAAHLTFADSSHLVQDPDTSGNIFKISTTNNKITINAVKFTPQSDGSTKEEVLGSPSGYEVNEPADDARLAITKNFTTGAKYLYVAITKHNPGDVNELVIYKGDPECLNFTSATAHACNWQPVNYPSLKNVGGFDFAVSSNGNPYIAFDSADSNNRGIRLYADYGDNIWGYMIQKDAQHNFPSDPESIHLLLADRDNADPLKGSYPTLAYVAYTDQRNLKLISSDNFNSVTGLTWKSLANPNNNNIGTNSFDFYHTTSQINSYLYLNYQSGLNCYETIYRHDINSFEQLKSYQCSQVQPHLTAM